MSFSLFAGIVNHIRSYTDPLVRDYTTDTEKRLKKIANEVDDSDDWFSRNVSDRFCRMLDKKGWLSLLSSANNYQRDVIDCYNYHFRVIEKIFQEARNLDQTYGRKISYYNSQAENGAILLKELANCLDLNVSMQDDSVHGRLEWFMTNWVNDANGKYVTVSDVYGELDHIHHQLQDTGYTSSEIQTFCEEENAENVFVDYSNYIYNDELSYGELQATGMVIFMGCKIAKDEVTKYMTGEGYTQKAVRENLSDIILSMMKSDSFSCTGFMSDHEQSKKIFLDFLECLEKNEKEKFKELHPYYEYTLLEKFSKQIGGVDALKKLVDVYPELIDYLFRDYSKGLEILNSLESLGCGNLTEEMQAAIEQMRMEYEEKYAGSLRMVWESVQDFGFEQSTGALKKWAMKTFPPMAVLNTILEFSGEKEKTEAYCKLLSLQTIANDTQYAFREAVAKIRNGTFTDDAEHVMPGQYTEADLKNVENLFNLMKQTEITVYETFRDMSIDYPMKQLYANEQIERLNNMTMRDYKQWQWTPCVE